MTLVMPDDLPPLGEHRWSEGKKPIYLPRREAGLPRVGESLDPGQTLAALARRHRHDGAACRRCRLSPYPRGLVTNMGLCWTCAFPRAALAAHEDEQ